VKPPATKEKAKSESSLGGRVKRYAQVTRAVGGLAAKLAGERVFGLAMDRPQHAAQLRTALGGLKGPLMKVAQILSTVPDALPGEYVTELAHLQSNAPRMGPAFVRRRMAAELGPDWPRRFKHFAIEAAAAASLGQVHRATHPDGRILACKLQYPDMDSVVAADLAQLKVIMALFRSYDGAIDGRDIHAELTERLGEELDYEREARHMRLYALMLAGEEGIFVPKPVAELSTRRLLSMTWLEGRPLLAFAEAPQTFRNKLAHHMFRAWYVPFYSYGVIHGDPHLGNYTVTPEGGVNLLDFGCIRVFPVPFVQGVIDLYRAVAAGDRDLAVSAYERWGFKGLKREVIEVLNLWASFLYAPLLEDRPRLIQENAQGGAYGREVAAKVHAELRRLGGVRPPREFVLMDRAAIGLGSVFLHLKAEINWHRLFHDVAGAFDAKATAKRQKDTLRRVGLSHP